MNRSTSTPAPSASLRLEDHPTGFILRAVPRVGTAPFVTCDACGQTIRALHDAGVVWDYDDLPCTPRVYCKFADPARKTLGCLSAPHIKHRPWMELSHYLFFLLHNLGLRTTKQITEEAKWARLANRF
jgi:hypothetical protein